MSDTKRFILWVSLVAWGFFSLVFPVHAGNTIVVKKKVVASSAASATPDKFSDTMDEGSSQWGVETETNGTWTYNDSSAGYTRMTVTGAASVIGATRTFTESTGATYIKVVFRLAVGMNNTYKIWRFLWVLDGAANPPPIICYLEETSANTKYRVICKNDKNTTAQSIATNQDVGNTWHTLVMKYNSDGSSQTQSQYDGGATSTWTDAEASNLDPDSVVCGTASANGAQTQGSLDVSEISVCTEANKTACGWVP